MLGGDSFVSLRSVTRISQMLHLQILNKVSAEETTKLTPTQTEFSSSLQSQRLLLARKTNKPVSFSAGAQLIILTML